MSVFDPRLTPARDDVAAAHLKGKIASERYVEGLPSQVVRGCADLRKQPSDQAGMQTQLLFGERFTIYDEKDGWAWGQAVLDAYVGYVRASFLSGHILGTTHRVTRLGTPLLTAPDVRSAAGDLLPLNAKLDVQAEEGRFLRLPRGYVSARSVAALSDREGDWVEVAERFIGAPYLWGGKTYAGIDCSGLIQTGMEAAGIRAPRDTDMIAAALGVDLPFTPELTGLQRGDLVFWKGHVGVMQDATALLHANAYFMEVTSEPLTAAAARIAELEGPIIAVKRIG